MGPKVVERLKKACTHDNPDYAKRMAMGYAVYNVPPKIKTWKVEGSTLTLARGVMQRVRDVLKDDNITYNLVDQRSEGAPNLKPLKYEGFPLRPYQQDAVREAMKKEQGIVRASTGSGKTTTVFALASEIGLNVLVILPSAKLLDQWMERAKSDLGLNPQDVGVLQAGKRRLRPLTVATQQTLWSRGVDKELKEFFGAVMIDEAHHLAARTPQEAIDAFPARYRIAFSADERRKDRKECIIYDVCGSIIHETGREACEKVGAVVDVEVRIVPTQFRADWYRNDQDFNKLLDEMTNDPERNSIITDIANEELEQNEQVIILSHRRDHARHLDLQLVTKGIRSGCMLGGQDAGDEKEFENTRNGLRSGEVRAGVGTYGALGEGIDLPAVAVGIAGTPISTNKQKFNQVRGRLCRPSVGKKNGRLYVLFDGNVFDTYVMKNILAWNKTVKILRNGKWVDARKG